MYIFSRLQGTCLKGGSCEFSHVLDVQEVVANKLTLSPKPTFAATTQQPLATDYPQLTSKNSTTTIPHHHHHHVATTTAVPVEINKEEEFPSLASASKISKKNTPTPVVKGGGINFAEAAKKKGLPQTKSKKIVKSSSGSSSNRGGGYHDLRKLTQPVHIPWLDTGSSLNSIYMKEVRHCVI